VQEGDRMSADNSVIFDALNSLQSTRSSMAQTLLYSATSLMQKGNYKQAVGVLKTATAYDPSATTAYSLMAQSYLKLNDTKSAKAAYQMVTRLDRSNGDAYLGMANIDIADKKYADAEKELKQAIRIAPTNEVGPYTLGQLYLTTDRNQEAAAQFQKVTKMVPKDGNGYYSLGVAYNKLGKYNDAVTVLTKAVALKKDFDFAYSELGDAYAKLGNTDQAQKQVDTLKTILTTQAQGLATTLAAEIKQPKITGYNVANSSFKTFFGAMTPLYGIDSSTFLNAPNVSKEFTIQFQFDSGMDVKSVMNTANWSIKKASGITEGRYENGTILNPQNEAGFSPIPNRVSYDATSRQATLTFTITQGASGASMIDPSHMVFKFSGKDLNGKAMDPTADQYDGFASRPF
jgi:tetratricopeptide (TPR) repeat protein